jgi:putative membrane protein
MEMADNRTDWAEERTHWAEERTDWALQRNVYAKERTFSAWMRTGLSSVAVGLGIARLLSAVGQEWVARTIGVLLILTGGVTYALSFWRYLQDYHELQEEGLQLTSVWLIGGLTLALILSAVLSMVLLFVQ